MSDTESHDAVEGNGQQDDFDEEDRRSSSIALHSSTDFAEEVQVPNFVCSVPCQTGCSSEPHCTEADSKGA